jgi:phosphatidylserine decarboxylase
MTIRSTLGRIADHEALNFWLTNYIPRRLSTRFVGWFAKIEQPTVRDMSIKAWRLFSDLDLSEAKKTEFTSLRDCFIRELKDGARPIDLDPAVLTSPCDAIVGACGYIEGTEILQVKGLPYHLQELLIDPDVVELYRDGTYVTLRLTASMYHRFHAPHDGHVDRVTHISGDTWNVNPPTLNRIDRVFCRNERATIRMQLNAHGAVVTLVPVAAILVAGLKLNFLDVVFDRNRRDPVSYPCSAGFKKGEEMGWFEHGSTIIVFAPKGFRLADSVTTNAIIRMGMPLLRRADPSQ